MQATSTTTTTTTTASAVASLPADGAITATVVPDEQRMLFLPRVFVRDYVLGGEMVVYQFMDQLAPGYKGSLWDFLDLSNGGFYLRPSGESYLMHSMNGTTETVSADAAGIVATLFTLSHLSFTGRDDLGDAYHLLYGFAAQHAEGRSILALID